MAVKMLAWDAAVACCRLAALFAAFEGVVDRIGR
jgi:hypothetical protein